MTYRPDIDGLRCIAVTTVVLFHAWPSAIPGGFTGVDIFFVISGYLITSIIFKEAEQDIFTYGSFYNKRVRRLYPALIVMISAVIWMGCTYLWEEDLKAMLRTLLAGVGFCANLQILSLGGEYDSDVKLNPLLHLWPLGVGAQFYLLWPWAAAAILKLSVRKAYTAFAALICISFFINIGLVYSDHVKVAFYLPFARFWELGSGAILAYFSHASRESKNIKRQAEAEDVVIKTPNFAMYEYLAGLGLIIIGMVVAKESSPYPGALALLPTLGALLLLKSGNKVAINKYILSNPLVTYVGKLSYPLYLWHWPLLVFSRIAYKGKSRVLGEEWFAVLLSVILSACTYHFVEGRLRLWKWKGVPFLLIGIMLALASLSLATLVNPASLSNLIPDNPSNGTGSISAPVSSLSGTGPISAPAVSPGGAGSISAPGSSPSGTGSISAPGSSPSGTGSVSAPGPSPSPSGTDISAPGSSQTVANATKPANRTKPLPAQIQAAVGDWLFPPPEVAPITFRSRYYGPGSQYFLHAPADFETNSSTPTVVLLGDSHGCAISHRFIKLYYEARGANKPFPTIVYKTNDGKPPLHCNDLFLSNLNIIKNQKPTAVMITTRWPQWIQGGGKPDDPLHSSIECCRGAYHSDTCDYQSPRDMQELFRLFKVSVKELVDLGIKVFVATMNPEGPAFNPRNMLNSRGIVVEANIRPVKRSEFRASYSGFIEQVENTIRESGATMIDFSDNLCYQDVCEVLDPNGNPINKDDDHFRPAYVREYLSSVDIVVDTVMKGYTGKFYR